MNRKLTPLVIAFLLFGFALLTGTARAGNNGASCTASPTEGVPGTVFDFVCSGFTPNGIVNVYVVEPDHRAISAGVMTGFRSNTSSFLTAESSVKADEDGDVYFTWESQNGSRYGFSHAIGTYTWVVHELGPGRAIVAQGQVDVTLTSVNAPQSGATLTVEPNDEPGGPFGRSFAFTGTGFVPGEIVNIWVTVPPGCSGRANSEPENAVDPRAAGGFEGISGPSSAKADETGTITFGISFKPAACPGFYTVTARALGSGIGGMVTFEVTGQVETNTAGALLTVTPNAVSAIDPYVTLVGTGFPAGVGINCWTTRPDGRVFRVGFNDSVSTGSDGSFVMPIQIEDYDSYLPYASEEPGLWRATCSTPQRAATAIAEFTVYSLTSDP